MSKIKLVLADIDGTLVKSGQHELSPAVRRTLEQVDAAAVEVVVTTGRPYAMMEEVFRNVNFKGFGIFDGGATIRDIKSGESMWQNWLDLTRVRALVSILMPVSQIIDCWPELRQVPPSEMSLDEIIEDAPYVFSFFHKEAKDLITEQLRTVPNITWHFYEDVADPNLCDIQITDIKADKFHAVSALRQITHSNKAETLAIGDSSNDLPLFKSAGIKVAMGNAIDELKQVADFVVSSVEDDGFVEAMNKFVLN